MLRLIFLLDVLETVVYKYKPLNENKSKKETEINFKFDSEN